MKFSIVIATMNRPAVLKNLLDSIEKQTFLPEEFVIVDQSTDGLTKAVIDEYAKKVAPKQAVKYYHQEKPSLVMARNRGVSESTGDIICFVDDDIILNADYYEKIAHYFKDESIGGLSGNVAVDNPPGGLKWEMRKILMRIFLISNFEGRMTPSTLGYPIFEQEINRIHVVELLPGYSMNFRRDLVVRNKADESMSGYSFREDVDLSYRISKEAKLIMAADIRFIHAHSQVNRQDLNNLKLMQFKNYVYLFKKFRKYGIFSYLLFYYSMFGVVLISFGEWVLNMKEEKYRIFKADMNAVAALMRGAL